MTLDPIHFGATVSFPRNNGPKRERVLGVLVGEDVDNAGCWLVSPNDNPKQRVSVPRDDLEPIKD